MKPDEDKPFRILTIDGGGIRRIVPVHIRDCLTRKSGLDLLKSFDMIAGTSMGRIMGPGIVEW